MEITTLQMTTSVEIRRKRDWDGGPERSGLETMLRNGINKFIRALWRRERGGGMGGKTLPKGEEIVNPIITIKKKKKKNVVNERKGNEFKTSSNPILTCKLED